ncbi:SDR family oxidoreductase [soil metagenome]
MRVLIAGCGYVGSALGTMLAAGGNEVFGLRRDPSALPQGIGPVALDLTQEIPSDRLPPNLDYVFYTASADSSDEAAYRSAYVDGPRNLLEVLKDRGDELRRFFFTSSTGVYGQSDGEWVDETSPTEPRMTGRILLEGEREVTASPYPTTIVRLAGIYGPGRTRSIVRGLEIPEADGAPVYTNRIHVDDCAGVLRDLTHLSEPEGLYLAVDSEPTDRRTVAEWIAVRLEQQPVKQYASNTRRLRTSKRFSNARLRATGYEFRYPTFREGCAALLDETNG